MTTATARAAAKAARRAEVAAKLAELPHLCGPVEMLGRTGYDGYCQRAVRVYGLVTYRQEIEDARDRLARLIGRGQTFRARNLGGWLADAEVRHARQVELFLERWDVCTHSEADRVNVTPDRYEEVLPACTCG